MIISPFAPHHRQGVADLILAIQRGEYGFSITYEDQPDLADIPGFYQQGAGDFWVALDGDQVVGSIGLRDIGDRAGALRKMFVASDYRGGTGVAGSLLTTLLDHARTQQLDAVYL